MTKIILGEINKPYKRVNYMANVGLDYYIEWIEDKIRDCGLCIKPDFQRNYVWTKKQKIKYIEHLLNGGTTGKDIFFNHPNWMGNWKIDENNPMVLVDGLQRTTAVLEFIDNKFKVYGKYYAKDIYNFSGILLNIHVNNLKSYKEVVEWYIELNNTGVKHTKRDIEHAKNILKKYTK